MYDVIVIGGGVVGAATARQLSKYQLKTLVLEKNVEVCQGTTKANSAIVHGGYDAVPGTLKAKLNVRGNQLYTNLSKELNFHFERVGSLVIAFDEEEMNEVRNLYERGIASGVPGLAMLDKEQLLDKEPALSPEVIGGLYCSSAGIVCPFNMTFALMENAIENGVELKTRTEVLDIQKITQEGKNGYLVKTSQGEFETRYLVNAAGLYSDMVANMVGDHDFAVAPRKGEYRILDKNVGNTVKHVIFQAPTKLGKGILVAPTVHGNIIVGPTAEAVSDVEDTTTSAEGIAKVDELSTKSVPTLPLNQTIRVFTGVRASGGTGDFMIYASQNAKGVIHAGVIDSPGLASSPAIAELMVELLEQEGLELTEKPDFNPHRRGAIDFAGRTIEQQQALIKENPAFAKVICRCETITEGEIIDAIQRPAGARTLDGVKRRVRPGSGRCQGGFCGPRVMEILSRELGIPMTEILKENTGSNIVTGQIKGGEKA